MKAVVALAVALVAAGCGIRPLTSAELYGAGARGGSDGGNGGGNGGGGTGGTSAGGTGGASGTSGSGGGGAAGTEAGSDGGGDGDASVCPQTCPANQFCDELTGNQCVSSSGSGMLSGTVTDACTGTGIAALVGIAGQHVCSYQTKGSYYVTNLPLGMLKLAAAKTGYDLFGDTVVIVAGGVVHDIHMMRVGGCSAPVPPDNACSCTSSSCVPP